MRVQDSNHEMECWHPESLYLCMIAKLSSRQRAPGSYCLSPFRKGSVNPIVSRAFCGSWYLHNSPMEFARYLDTSVMPGSSNPTPSKHLDREPLATLCNVFVFRLRNIFAKPHRSDPTDNFPALYFVAAYRS